MKPEAMYADFWGQVGVERLWDAVETYYGVCYVLKGHRYDYAVRWDHSRTERQMARTFAAIAWFERTTKAQVKEYIDREFHVWHKSDAKIQANLARWREELRKRKEEEEFQQRERIKKCKREMEMAIQKALNSYEKTS